MINRAIRRTFSVTQKKLKKALLLPSKVTVFPFQSHVSVISEDDKVMIQTLGFDRAISSCQMKYLEEIQEEDLEFMDESKAMAQDLIGQFRKEQKSKEYQLCLTP